MKVKRYIGKTTHEAIQKVKDDLGNEAIILNTRNIHKKGWLKWFSKPLVEVVAAIDEYGLVDTRLAAKQMDLRLLNQHSSGSVSLERLESRMDAMNDLIKSLIDSNSLTSKPSNQIEVESSPFYKQLTKSEVQDDIARMLIDRANELKRNGQTDFENCLEKLMLQIIGKPQPISASTGKRKIALFIGPTGVGKTTTLAKLAAILALKQKKQIGLITADTYRIAAADQLRIYSDILGIPLMVIYSPKEIKGALSVYSDKDVILIDTAGKSLNDKAQHKEIEELIALSGADDIYITIASNTSYMGYMNIINKYKFIPDYKLIFTKMDEATAYGIILNCCCMAGKTLSYMTTGQNVPDDIELIDPDKIVSILMGRQMQ
jgi:flagellar biosynthesis protein FlhF